MKGMAKLSDKLHQEGRCSCRRCQELQRKKQHERRQDRIIGDAWVEAVFSS